MQQAQQICYKETLRSSDLRPGLWSGAFFLHKGPTRMEEENTGPSASRWKKKKKTSKIDGAVASSGLTPLEFMLELLHDERAALDDRKWAACHAAPYCHARISTVAHDGALILRH